MKKKLKINELKVSSFVTALESQNDNPNLKGGRGRSNERSCVISIIYCYSENYGCPTAVPICRQ